MAILTRINRYPVKGLSAQTLPEVELSEGRGVPKDREYAVALAGTDFDETSPRPLPKTKFAVLARFSKLAELRTNLDFDTNFLTLAHDNKLLASGNLKTRSGREAIEDGLGAFMGDELGGRTRIVSGNGHRFTDVSVHSPILMESISIINLATVRAFEEKLQRPVDHRRFRGNLLIDGIEPWSEFELIDREFLIGDVAVRGVRRTKRCPATEVNPDTAERDIHVPLELLNRFGHGDLGIYVSVVSNGMIRPGDQIELPH